MYSYMKTFYLFVECIEIINKHNDDITVSNDLSGSIPSDIGKLLNMEILVLGKS